ncbi:hypothetical protein FLA_1342 [Filimonas lacunae]|nr:hypothetical protein FLA_1342 [Filimonas lacunae]
MFDDFLRFFFKEADTLFDMQREFQYLDKELEQLFPADTSNTPRFVDKLVKVYTKEGKDKWILVHVEVQGYDDKHFAKRMFTYFYRILDKYDKPVTAVAIFTDGNKRFIPSAYCYEFLGTKNTFEFNTYKIIEQDEQQLSEDENPFATIVLTVLLALKKQKGNDENLFRLKYALAKSLLQKQIPRKKIDKLLIFLQFYVHFANPDYNIKFDEAIEVLTNNAKTMGIREFVLDRAEKVGFEKGRVQERQELKHAFVANLLAVGQFTNAQIADLAYTTQEYVEEVKKSLQ